MPQTSTSRTGLIALAVAALAAAILAGCAPQRSMVGASIPSVEPPATQTAGRVAQVGTGDDGATINLRPGGRFVLNLGEGYDWNIEVSDPSVLGRVTYDMIAHGTQGTYEGLKPGQATVSASGTPACAHARPACTDPPRSLFLTVVVSPESPPAGG